MLNTNPQSDRLYGMMQMLMVSAANNEIPPAAARRGVVEEQDAVDAVLNMAAYIDAHMQSGVLSQNDAAHMAALLMVLRDYVRPLPEGLVDHGDDNGEYDGVTGDLEAIVSALREAAQGTGVQG